MKKEKKEKKEITLKTPEELFKKHSIETKYLGKHTRASLIHEFTSAIAEDRKQIKRLIDSMTPKVSKRDEENNWGRIDIAMNIAIKHTLIKLKNKLDG